MESIRAISLMILLAVGVPANAGDACFCMVDADDNIRRDCKTQQQGPRTVYHCYVTRDIPVTIDDLSGWKRLADGEGLCRPCQLKDDTGEDKIRGGGEAVGDTPFSDVLMKNANPEAVHEANHD